MTTTTEREYAPGLTAIVTAMAKVHGADSPPQFWQTEEGKGDLEGIAAYPARDHWHFVSYGLSDLHGDEVRFPAHADASGYGFELTLRCPRTTAVAPVWPRQLFQRLAAYVYRSSNVFRPGDHMALGAPLGDTPGSALDSLLFAPDPSLQPIRTRFGEVRFNQVVGITPKELEAVKNWRADAVLELMSRNNPLLVTDPLRPCSWSTPAFAQACREGAKQEGSGHGASFAPMVSFKEDGLGNVHVKIAAVAVNDIRRALKLRLPFNKPFRLHGRRAAIHLLPGLDGDWAVQGSQLAIQVPWDAASGMSETLQERRGLYPWPHIPGLTIEVMPTDVRGPRGELVRVIG